MTMTSRERLKSGVKTLIKIALVVLVFVFLARKNLISTRGNIAISASSNLPRMRALALPISLRKCA